MKKFFFLALTLLAGLFGLQNLLWADDVEPDIPKSNYEIRVVKPESKKIVLYKNDVADPIKLGVDRKTNDGLEAVSVFSKTSAGSVFVVLRIDGGDKGVYTDTLDSKSKVENYQLNPEYMAYKTGNVTALDFVLHEVKKNQNNILYFEEANASCQIAVYQWDTAGESRWKAGQATGVSKGSYINLGVEKDSTVDGNFKNGTVVRWVLTDPDNETAYNEVSNTFAFPYQPLKAGKYSVCAVFYKVEATLTPWKDTLRMEFNSIEFKLKEPKGADGLVGNPLYYDTMPYCAFDLPEEMEMGLTKGKYFIQAKVHQSEIYDTIATTATANAWLLPRAKYQAAQIATNYFWLYFDLYKVTDVAENGEITATQEASASYMPSMYTGRPQLDWYLDASGNNPYPLRDSYSSFSGVRTRLQISNGALSQAEGGSMVKMTFQKKYVDTVIYEAYITALQLIIFPTMTVPGEYLVTFQLQRHKGGDTVDWAGVKLTHSFTLTGEDPDKETAPKLPSVTASPDTAASYNIQVDVTLAHVSPFSKIFYRLKAEENFREYTGKFRLTETTTVEAFAQETDRLNSDTSRFTFKVIPPVYVKLPSVKFNPNGGSFDTVMYVKLTHDSADAAIFYRRDTVGAFTAYNRTDSIKLTDTAYVEAFATKTNGYFHNSDTARVLFKVKRAERKPDPEPVKLSTVKFTPDGGSFDDTVYVRLSHDSVNAAIYYRTGATSAFTAYTRTDSIMLSDTVTLEAYAALTGCINSDTVRKLFNVKEPEKPVDEGVYPSLSFHPEPEAKYEEGEDFSIIVKASDGAVLRKSSPADEVNASLKLKIYDSTEVVFSETVMAIQSNYAQFITLDLEESDSAGLKMNHTYKFEFTLYHNRPGFQDVWLDEEGHPIVISCEIEIVPFGTLPKDYDFEWLGTVRDTVNIHSGYGQLSYRFKIKENVVSETPYFVVSYLYNAKPDETDVFTNVILEGALMEPDDDSIYTFDSAYLDYTALSDSWVSENIKEGDYTLELLILRGNVFGGSDVVNRWRQSVTVIDVEGAVKLPSVVMTPDGGLFTEDVTVTLKCDSAEATLYYRTNPDSAFRVYTAGGFKVTDTCTVEAFAALEGFVNSDTISCEFFINKGDHTWNEGVELQGVSVYPNPAANGRFNVKVPVRANVEIFNAVGVAVMRETAVEGLRSYELRTSGIYFVRVTSGKQSTVKRIIVR